MSFITPLLVTLFGTSMLSVIIKKKFEISLPIFLMSCALIVYVLGVFNLFEFGIYFIIAFSAFFPIYLSYKKFKCRKSLRDILKYVITPGLIMYVLIYTFIFVLNYNRGFSVWDEFSHWGNMVKETFRLKDFYTSSKSILRVHQDYPPIITIFETIWCILSGGYKESLLYTSLQILGISLIFPFLSKFEFKRNAKSIVMFLLCFLILITVPILVTVGEASFYSTVYTDATLGLLIGYGLGIVLINKKYDKFLIFNLMILFSFIILTKQIAIVFVMLIIGNMILNMFLNKKINRENIKKNYKTIFLSIIMMIIVPITLTLIWNGIVKSNGIVGQFNLSNIKFTKLIGIYRGTVGEVYQQQTIHNFINTILYDGKFLNISFIGFTYVQLIVISCTLIYFLGRFAKNIIDNNRFVSLIITIIIGSIGYAFTMMVLYVFCFDSYEAQNLASIYRYINTYWLAIFAMIGMIYLYIVCKKENNKILHFSLPIIFVFCFWFNGNVLKTFKPVLTAPVSYFQYDVNLINSNIDNNDKIYIIAQNTNGYETFVLQYLLSPNKTNLEYYSLGEKYSDGDIWTKDITPENWFDKLKDYDYLYLYNVDEKFANKYGIYFNDNPTNIVSKKLYKVNKNSKTLDLII